ncbi:MAG: septum formation initiator family protein, partial [Vulcanococcus sp.]|nr:septum formation initiator family protein [Vulcanococcus sp.]
MSDDVQTPAPDSAPAKWQELALRELQQQREALEAEIKELSGRRDQLQQEINSSFAGQSDSIARRVKGFQDYLVGA